MDQAQRIETFRQSLPPDQREAFDALSPQDKDALSAPGSLHAQRRASSGGRAEKSAPVKFPSFPAPDPLPEAFLDELDAHPLATFIRIKREGQREMAAWMAGCCQYIGSFLDQNARNPAADLTKCHLSRRNIEACAKLLYLSAIVDGDQHSLRYFVQFSAEITASFYPLDISNVPRGTSDVQTLRAYLEAERQRQRPDRWIEDWKEAYRREEREAVEKREQAKQDAASLRRAEPAPTRPASPSGRGAGCLCMTLGLLAAAAALAFL